jgi:hypothetical protein
LNSGCVLIVCGSAQDVGINWCLSRSQRHIPGQDAHKLAVGLAQQERTHLVYAFGEALV